ncbi:MAG: hypothetical protein ACRD12_16920 [Acidimicrobiales bacterium]
MAPAARSLQARLEKSLPPRAPRDDTPAILDPVRLLRSLEESGRFHRDRMLGRIFHPGRVSLRENTETDSLHIVVHDNRVLAHVDRVSPLGTKAEGPPRYSLRAAAAHNVLGMAQDLLRLVRGRQGDHRSNLACEWLGDSGAGVTERAALLDPATSAWSVHLEVGVTGTLNGARLRAAMERAFGRRPFDHDPLDVVECRDDAALGAARSELQARPATMTEWPPLRARLAHHPGGDVLMLNLNHAASDGFAAVAVLRSIAAAYAGDDDPQAPKPDFLATRDLPVRPYTGDDSMLLRWYHTLVEQLRDLLAYPARLAPDHARDTPGYGIHLVQLSPEDTRRVVNADRPGTSRNILLASLHLAIGDWNLRHGTPGRRIGVLVPVNLRPISWPEHLIGNFSVTARVSTGRRQRAGRASALKAVTAETTRNKKGRTGIALVEALERAGLLPLWAKQSLIVLQPLTRNRKVDTAMLANLGHLDDPPSFGEAAGEPVEMWFSLPARAPESLCVGAVTVNGRMHLAFRYPHRIFSPDAVRRFADYFLAQIRLMGTDDW